MISIWKTEINTHLCLLSRSVSIQTHTTRWFLMKMKTENDDENNSPFIAVIISQWGIFRRKHCIVL